VVLSADGSEDRKVEALDQGADNYMTKPFGMRELNARIKVALRHHQPPADSQPPELDVGALSAGLTPGCKTIGETNGGSGRGAYTQDAQRWAATSPGRAPSPDPIASSEAAGRLG